MKKALHAIKESRHIKRIREHEHYPHLKKKTKWMIEGVIVVSIVSALGGYAYGRLAYGSHGQVAPVVDVRKPLLDVVCTNDFGIHPTYYKKNTSGMFEMVSLVVAKSGSTSTYELPAAISGSGARYASPDEKIVFWEHQGEFSFFLNDKEVSVCHVEKKKHKKTVDTTVTLHDLSVDMRDGVGVAAYGPEEQFSVTLRQFGEPEFADYNNDGFVDAALLLTYEGGSSPLYYAVFALSDDQGMYTATNALLVGGDITPRSVSAKEGGVYYAFSLPTPPGSTATSTEPEVKSLFVSYDMKTKQIVDTEKTYTPTYDPETMTLSDKRWTWSYTQPMNGKKITPRKPGSFNIVFDENKIVHIQTDCNLYTGTFSVDREAIWLYDLSSVGIYCGDTQEEQFMLEIRQVSRFFFTTSGGLVLTYNIGNSQMFFK